MNENLNLVEILKDCPKGTKLYSPIFGEVFFKQICKNANYPIIVTTNNILRTFTKECLYSIGYEGECLLFPSKDNHDWSKFNPKKPKFDPKTLKPFDKVLVANDVWQTECFLHLWRDDSDVWCHCYGDSYRICIPYNDDTKHLIGTTEEAPEFYRYWED